MVVGEGARRVALGRLGCQAQTRPRFAKVSRAFIKLRIRDWGQASAIWRAAAGSTGAPSGFSEGGVYTRDPVSLTRMHKVLTKRGILGLPI